MRDWPQRVKAKFQEAAFLDRDGTITIDSHFPHRIAELEFLPRSIQAIRVLAPLPIHIIVVSNQAGIALGLFRTVDMTAYNAELRRRIEASGGRIDAFYYCPHREPKHLEPGEKPCECAKPAPGMLLEAARDFHLDLKRSVMIGDKLSDVAAGWAAGCKTILVRTGKGGMENDELITATPDLVVTDLFDAVSDIHAVASLR